MLDIGFPELLLLSLVMLLVLGPRQLPDAMRAFGNWYGRMRYTVSRFSRTLEQELDAQEIAGKIAGEENLQKLKEAQASLQNIADESNSLAAELSVAPAQEKPPETGPDALPESNIPTSRPSIEKP